MFNESHLKIMTDTIIFVVLSIVLLAAWGCDQYTEIPTSESLEVPEYFSTEEPGDLPDTGVSAAPAAAGTIPLNLFWNALSTDYLTIAQPKALLGAPAQGHVFQVVTGQIFPIQNAGTVPLKLFWNRIRKDYLTTTANAVPPGYVIVRIEGFVFADAKPGTVPLKLFWNAGQADYLTRTGMAPAGYAHVRTEGYVYP